MRAARSQLGDKLLLLCLRAQACGLPSVAEHLMRALEELALMDPEAEATLDEAYLISAGADQRQRGRWAMGRSGS